MGVKSLDLLILCCELKGEKIQQVLSREGGQKWLTF